MKKCKKCIKRDHIDFQQKMEIEDLKETIRCIKGETMLADHLERCQETEINNWDLRRQMLDLERRAEITWMPIDTTSKDEEERMLQTEDSQVWLGCFNTGSRRWESSCGTIIEPIYWQPKPSPVKETGRFNKYTTHIDGKQ